MCLVYSFLDRKSCVKSDIVSVYMIPVGLVECFLYVYLTEKGSNGANFKMPLKEAVVES